MTPALLEGAAAGLSGRSWRVVGLVASFPALSLPYGLRDFEPIGGMLMSSEQEMELYRQHRALQISTRISS